MLGIFLIFQGRLAKFQREATTSYICGQMLKYDFLNSQKESHHFFAKGRNMKGEGHDGT